MIDALLLFVATGAANANAIAWTLSLLSTSDIKLYLSVQ